MSGAHIVFKKVGAGITSHPWAIVEDGIVSQARFDCEAAAQIAFRNFTLSGGR